MIVRTIKKMEIYDRIISPYFSSYMNLLLSFVYVQPSTTMCTIPRNSEASVRKRRFSKLSNNKYETNDDISFQKH